jgi:predicted MFS family arabinose efflux permease
MPERETAEPRLFTRNFVVASFVHFTGGMSTATFILFPLFISRQGGDELLIGQVMGIGAAAAVVTRPLAGQVLDRFGGRAVLLGAGAVNALAIAGLLLLDRLSLVLELLFVVHSVAAGALFASYFTYAAHIVPLGRRTEGVAMFGIAGMLPNGLAPPLGEFLIDRWGSAAFFAASAGFSLLSLVLTWFLEDERTGAPHHSHERTAGEARGDAQHTRERWFRLAFRPELRAILIATTFFGFGLAALFTFLAPYALATGRGPVGPFFLGYAVAAIVTRLVGSRLPDRVGPRRIVMPALVAYGVGLALVSFTSGSAGLIIVGLVCGAAHGYIFPILNVLVVARTPARVRGAAVSLYTAMIDLGTMIGGPVLGAIAKVGYRPMFLVAAGVTWSAVAVLVVLDRPRLVGDLG